MIGGDDAARVMVAREQFTRWAESCRHDVEGGALDGVGHFLLQARHGDARLADDLARIGSHRAVEQLHDGALPRAVAAEEAHALAALDGEARAVEDRRSAERDAYILHAQQCHAEGIY